MPKVELQKYGAPLYAIEWFDRFGYMCGGGNNGIENKYVGLSTNATVTLLIASMSGLASRHCLDNGYDASFHHEIVGICVQDCSSAA